MDKCLQTFHTSCRSRPSSRSPWGRTRSTAAWCFQPPCTRSPWPGSPARTGRTRAGRPPDPSAGRPLGGRGSEERPRACSRTETGSGTPPGREHVWCRSAWCGAGRRTHFTVTTACARGPACKPVPSETPHAQLVPPDHGGGAEWNYISHGNKYNLRVL